MGSPGQGVEGDSKEDTLDSVVTIGLYLWFQLLIVSGSHDPRDCLVTPEEHPHQSFCMLG